MKKIKLRHFVALAFIGLFSLQAYAQFNNNKTIDAFLDKVERNDQAHGTISIFKHGKEVYNRAFGYQDIGIKKPTSANTKYRIGSISKIFTAAMVMQAIEEGKLSLDTKLSRFFPQLPNAEKISIEHLLRHQSGFKEIVRGEGMEAWIQQARTHEEVLAQFKKMGADFKPGEKQEYNNNGFVILSYILEKIDGKSFPELLEYRITKPIQLSDTYYGAEMGTDKQEAISYSKDEKKWTKAIPVHHSMPLGAGGIISMPTNLNVFINKLFNHKIVNSTTLNNMLPPKDSEVYGMGLMNYTVADVKAYGHTGGIDGFKSWVIYFPSLDVSIAYDTNGQDMGYKKLVETVFELYQKEEQQAQLTQTIFKQDSLLFDAMFNKHDVAYLKNILTTDFEFYHDKGGQIATSSDDIIKSFERIWKKQEAGEKNWQRRELINESFEVYPLNNYGVMQVADHKFYETKSDGTEFLMDTAKFMHLWKETDEGWKLAQVVSYDHQAVTNPSFEMNTVLEQTVKELMQKYKVPTVGIGLINDGKITYSKTFGTQADGEQATNNTIFKVASITKPVVATTVLKLVDAGLWDLDEPLYKYWIDPDIADDPRTKKLTTRLILNMKSGLPNWRHLSDSGKLEFLFELGERAEYSGEGFEYLKESIQAKFNTPLETIVQKMLFDKQGMKNIRFWWDDTMDESLYAGNYNNEGEQYKTHKYHAALAAGNILATVDDYLKFGVHVLGGAGLSNNMYSINRE